MKNTDEALGKAILKGIELAEKSGKFIIEQAPELIQQFYTWHICQNLFGLLIGVLLFFISYKIIKSLGKDEESWDNEFLILGKWVGIGQIISSTVLSVIGSVFLILSSYELIFIITAPKLYLIEYFIK